MAFFGTRRFDVHAKRSFMNQFSNMRGTQFATRSGFTKLGIAGLKGVDILPDTYEITVDLQQALQRQGTRLQRATRS